RRGQRNAYCNSLGGEFGLARIRSVRQMDQLLSEAYPSRYMKLNCQSYEIHGTVEFRQHQGTMDGEKIANWVVLTQMMVERAVAGKIRMKSGANDWFNLKKVIRGYKWMGADETQQEAVSYYNKRRQAFMKAALTASAE
ncbi:amidoligase family protein, partial [Candidatus Darwinibacter acetoxidans]